MQQLRLIKDSNERLGCQPERQFWSTDSPRGQISGWLFRSPLSMTAVVLGKAFHLTGLLDLTVTTVLVFVPSFHLSP